METIHQNGNMQHSACLEEAQWSPKTEASHPKGRCFLQDHYICAWWCARATCCEEMCKKDLIVILECWKQSRVRNQSSVGEYSGHQHCHIPEKAGWAWRQRAYHQYGWFLVTLVYRKQASTNHLRLCRL